MLSVSEITAEIIRREGGYVNDPDDPGGATNFGVTIHTMRRLGIDKNRDGIVNVTDVKLLTAEDAADIFMRHYFYGPRINELPRVLQATVYDMYVNAGSNAVKILQRLVSSMGEHTTADGAIGPKTLQAVQSATNRAPGHIADAYGIARRNYYLRLADRRPASRKYARTRAGGKGGWIKRAEEFISPQYHMTDRQFKQRTARWD